MSSSSTRQAFKAIFVIGPSGVGKNWFSELIKEKLNLCLLDIDVDGHFEGYGLKDVWNEFIKSNRCLTFIECIKTLPEVVNQSGVIISLPSSKALKLKLHHIQDLQLNGHSVVLLWGEKEFCIKARIERDTKSRIIFNEIRYESKNNRLFDEFRKSEYDPYRIEMFDENRKRPTAKDVLNQISNKCLI